MVHHFFEKTAALWLIRNELFRGPMLLIVITWQRSLTGRHNPRLSISATMAAKNTKDWTRSRSVTSSCSRLPPVSVTLLTAAAAAALLLSTQPCYGCSIANVSSSSESPHSILLHWDLTPDCPDDPGPYLILAKHKKFLSCDGLAGNEPRTNHSSSQVGFICWGLA